MAIGDLVPRRRSGTPILRGGGNANPLSAFHEEMNRLFEDFWRDFDLMPSLPSGSGFGWPSIDVSETDKKIRVVAELPGVEEKDLEVLLDNDVLCIRGEKKGESQDGSKAESQDQSPRLHERYYGRFERRIALDAEVEQDKITASFKQGVLTIDLPKSEQTSPKSKRIQITH